MSDRVAFVLPSHNVQTRAFRSQSFNPPPTLASHRSRRTLSLPAREKPIIPPAISETAECSAVLGEQQSGEQKQECLEAKYFDEICKYALLGSVTYTLRKITFVIVCSVSGRPVLRPQATLTRKNSHFEDTSNAFRPHYAWKFLFDFGFAFYKKVWTGKSINYRDVGKAPFPNVFHPH